MSGPVPTRRAALVALASAGAALAPVCACASVDPIPALHTEAVRVTTLLNSGRLMTEAEDEALMDRWGDCCDAASATRATTPAGAAASIEWAKDELMQFGFNLPEPGADPDKGARFVLALLDSALGVLRGIGGAA